MTMLQIWRRLRTLPGLTWIVLIFVVIALLPTLGAGYGITRQVELTLILALIVGGMNLSYGYAGELALGQVAMYAAGAYGAGLIAKAGVTEIWVQLIVGMVLALIIGIASGVPGLRLGGWSLAMTSFFLILIVPDVLSILKGTTGGQNGLSGIDSATLFGADVSESGYFFVVVVVAALWFVVMRNLVVSRHGAAMLVLKQSPVLATSLGISVFRTKLLAYAIGAIPAGLAGSLFANLDLFLSPDAFNFSVAMTVLAASIFGGSASIYGALVGAAVLQFGMNQSTNFQQFGLLISGAFLLLGGVAFTGGVAGLVQKAARRIDRAAGMLEPADSPAGGAAGLGRLSGAVMTIEHVSKSFGGNRALDDVSVEARPGQVTALIGPNGSGKTTLLNMASGFYRADSGEISLDGSRIDRMSPYRVARAGLARTFQTPNIPAGETVLQAVQSGRYYVGAASVLASILRLPRFGRLRREDIAEAEQALAMVGIDGYRNDMAQSLSLGHRRLLEVARSLVARPKVLLLDEVASGLDEDELDVLESLVRKLCAAGMTVLLVEHNFQLVLRLADVIYVLAEGKVMAHGEPSAIADDPRVLAEYLGVVAETDPATEEVQGA